YESGDPLAGYRALVAGNGIAPAAHAVLVTNLRVANYTFNPVSFVLGYDAGDRLVHAVAEVNNTYGGRFRYLLAADEMRRGDRIGFRTPRELFVSPFLHGDALYDFRFAAPLDGDLAITMYVERAGARIFTAHLAATREPLTDRTLAAAALRYPLMAVQVVGLIHWQAVKLRWQGVPYRRPRSDHRPLP
ncbi:MAG TPA: DUF1365 family protein, partial [Kofleriaceae bacterium]